MILRRTMVYALALMAITACASNTSKQKLPQVSDTTGSVSGVNAEEKTADNGGSDSKKLIKYVDKYLIGVDDRVQVSVWRNPDLSVTVPVRPDGMISIPLVGDIQAGGLSAERVAADITKKLSLYVRDPHVAVILTELRSHEYISRVRITGSVRNPISLPFRQGMTVLDAVLAAGGIDEFASPNGTKVYRKSKNGSPEIIKIRLGKILTSGKLETNYKLVPGDVITVPERLF